MKFGGRKELVGRYRIRITIVSAMSMMQYLMFCGCSSQTKKKIEKHKAIQTEIEKRGNDRKTDRNKTKKPTKI